MGARLMAGSPAGHARRDPLKTAAASDKALHRDVEGEAVANRQYPHH